LVASGTNFGAPAPQCLRVTLYLSASRVYNSLKHWSGVILLNSSLDYQIMSMFGSFPTALPVEKEEGGAAAILDAMLEERLPKLEKGERTLAVGRLQAQASLRLESLQSARESTKGPTPAPCWEPVGPAPISYSAPNGPWSGMVPNIAVDPQNHRRIFLAAGEGGIWRSLDRGKSWKPVSDSACSLETGSIVIDPRAPQIIYAGTGDQTFRACPL
jgi:hypothetical protein